MTDQHTSDQPPKQDPVTPAQKPREPTESWNPYFGETPPPDKHRPVELDHP